MNSNVDMTDGGSKSDDPAPKQNHLLAALPAAAQERLIPQLELVEIPVGEVITEYGKSSRHVYFPTNSIVSLLSVDESGSSAQVALVGNEGLVGIAVYMGGESMTSRAIVQSDGYAYRLPSSELKEEFNRHGDLQVLLLKYTQALITQMVQMAVCNRHHSIGQRLCRLLLLSMDQLRSESLTMTQQFIAELLGVRREDVTEAARQLDKRGVIEYHRSHIEVLDRPQLETHSCECYLVVKAETERLLPYVPRVSPIK